MRFSFLFLLILISADWAFSQDKIYFTNGTTKKGIIVSNTKELVYFKTTDTSSIEKIEKNKILLIEDYKGTRYIIGKKRNENTKSKIDSSQADRHLNYAGIQPLSIFLGRVTLSYERLSKDGRFGIAVPIIFTFDPVGKFYNDTLFGSGYQATPGIGIISGLDLNYYLGKKENTPFYIGPRFRYGVDKFMGITGYSIQTQVGWKIGRPSAKSVQHISFGFGFIRIIEAVGVQNVDSKQSYTWGSINYRISFSW